MNSGQLSLTFADMLTKCLPSADQRRYREVLGYEVRELTLLSSLAMSGGSSLPLGDASGSVMSLLRQRNTCILCGDVLSSSHRPQEVSGAQPCDLSSLRFSCVFVDMSSSSTCPFAPLVCFLLGGLRCLHSFASECSFCDDLDCLGCIWDFPI